MSQENVEIVRSVYREPDSKPFFELLDEEVEVDFSTHPLPDFPVFLRGKDAATDWWRHYWGTWDSYVVEATVIINASEDRIVVVQRERGRGRGSGAPFERHAALIFTFGASRVVRVQFFSSRDNALEAVGLRE